MLRTQMWDALLDDAGSDGRPWDVIVIGGGATGLGTALDAASRGYRTVLVEAVDFAKGTSSRSTKLIHGGVRYLRQGRIGMVRESLRERGRLLANAPHIVHARRFVIPSYRFGSRYYYFAGMKAYDALAGRWGFAPSQLLSARETLQSLPTLRDRHLRGGVAFADGQFDDARLAVALAQSIVDCGGIVLNYAQVVRLLDHGGRTNGVVVRDRELGNELELCGKVVVNATGVFGESIMHLDPSPEDASHPSPRIVASRGSHLVLPREFLPGSHGLLIPETDDGRVLFAIPWQGRTLFGTTDQKVQEIVLEPKPSRAEIDYLLEYAGKYLTRQPQRSDVLAVFAGLRPLVGSSGHHTSTAQLSREHEIHASSGGLITVIGGKWTTYRQMGQDVIDLAARVANLPHRPSGTAEMRLHAAPEPGGAAQHFAQSDQADCEPAAHEFEWAAYGSHRLAIERLAEQQPHLSQPLDPRLPTVGAQVVWAVEHEMARTVEDVLARRTRGLFLDASAAMAAAEPTAQLMCPLLGRDQSWVDQQVRGFCELATAYLPEPD